MEENRPGLLNAAFVGIAKDKLTQAINNQASNGLKRRYIDRGHKVQVVFYSIDGSAIEMHDTVRLEIQLLDGSKVVHSEQATLYYIALMSPAKTVGRCAFCNPSRGSERGNTLGSRGRLPLRKSEGAPPLRRQIQSCSELLLNQKPDRSPAFLFYSSYLNYAESVLRAVLPLSSSTVAGMPKNTAVNSRSETAVLRKNGTAAA